MKRSTPLRSGSKRIAPRRSRFTPDRSIFERIYQEQEGRCAICEKQTPLEGSVRSRMHDAHLDQLGMGASRHNPDDPRNARENRVGLCATCHDVLDLRLSRDERRRMVETLRSKIPSP